MTSISVSADPVRQHVRRRARRQAPATVTVVAVQRGVDRVKRSAITEAVAAIRALPAADRALLVRAGVAIFLHPSASLDGGMLGATTITRARGEREWQPTKIRVATEAQLRGKYTVGEIVQHEIGHAIAVLRSQDRSEHAAIEYARRY